MEDQLGQDYRLSGIPERPKEKKGVDSLEKGTLVTKLDYFYALFRVLEIAEVNTPTPAPTPEFPPRDITPPTLLHYQACDILGLLRCFLYPAIPIFQTHHIVQFRCGGF